MSVPVSRPGSRPAPTSRSARPRGRVRQVLVRVPDTVRAYVGLTKTRIIEQLLVVTVPAMFLAERGVPPVPLILATLVGGAGAAASAHALNCVIDADIDVKMKRTARRPLARGQVPPSHALVFGLVLAALSTVWLWLTTNQLAAGLALTAIAFYVLVYTLILKRRTSQNIVWGGAAGCMPVVIGWAAVTGMQGSSDWAYSSLLVLIIFIWTPPHFWALAIFRREDYAKAEIPMLPVTHGVVHTRKQIMAYSVVLALVCLLPYLVGMSGAFYLGGAIVLNAVFLWYAWRMLNPPDELFSMNMFSYSIVYLMALFAFLLVDHWILPWL